MKKSGMLVLLAALCIALSGCQVTGEVENQAYVLVLALDSAEDGALTLTARVPQIGKSGNKGEQEKAGDSPYLVFSVSAPSWSLALDALQWSTPRQVNLSHIEMIVASEALASQASFPELMNQIADTPHLYTNARFVVCAGSARAFLEAGKTVIGTRLSSEINAMLSQYARQSYIPDASFADACYSANAIYGDPIAIWGYTADAAPSGNDRGISVVESPMRQRFSGTALFRRGVFVRALSSEATRLLNLIRGQSKVLSHVWQDASYELTLDSPPDIKILIDGSDVTISLRVALHIDDSLPDGVVNALETAIKADIDRLIVDCRQAGCDPFGFAELAAGQFATVPQWLAFDWPGRYARAAVETLVHVSRRQAS